MRRSLFLLGLVLAGLASVASARAQTSLKPKFTGVWNLTLDKSELKSAKLAALTLNIDHPEKALIHVVETAKAEGGQEKRREYTCSTMGRECNIDQESQAATMSIYYDGPKLVMMERIGKESNTVIKRIYQLSEDASTLTVQWIQLVPPRSDVDKLIFAKAL